MQKCGGTNHYKNACIKGEQRYKCKECGYQFVPTLNKGCDKQTKATACLLYINDLSFRTIGKLLNVSATSVFYWFKNFAITHYEKPKPVSEYVMIKLDGDKKIKFFYPMWHFLHLKKQTLDKESILL